MAIYKIVLIRHGESVWNKENKFTGWSDVDLSEKGIEEAAKAGYLLKKEGFTFDLAYTSVLTRAIKSLWHVLNTMDNVWIPVIKSWKLNERHYGSLQGLNDINAYKQTESFLEVIGNSANAPAIKTGFDKFDEALGGGLRAGRLYGIGAISSLGKTTFVLQIADNIARTGQDVLIFSLEMSRNELMGKSVSRGTYRINSTKATSLQSILDFSEQQSLPQENKQILDKAIVDYRDNVAKHINISEGVGDIGVKQVRELVEKFSIFKNSKPIVIIDYLQILASFNERLTDKQNIDKNVLELKRICRDYQVPIIIINSFNRTNYLTEASFEAFKESGAIEYSCDILIALQLFVPEREQWKKDEALHIKNKAYNDAKVKIPRDIEVIILKNRANIAYKKLMFQYLPQYDYFEEVEKFEETKTTGLQGQPTPKIRRKKSTAIQYDDGGAE